MEFVQPARTGELARNQGRYPIGGVVSVVQPVAIAPGVITRRGPCGDCGPQRTVRRRIEAGAVMALSQPCRRRRSGAHAQAGRGRRLRGQEYHAVARLPSLCGIFDRYLQGRALATCPLTRDTAGSRGTCPPPAATSGSANLHSRRRPSPDRPIRWPTWPAMSRKFPS